MPANAKNNKGKSGGRRGRSDEGMVDVDIKVDETKRYKGTVVYFEKRRGFGFISLNDKGVVPDDKMMVVWKDILSADRWPYLNKDMEVELGIQKFVKKNGAGAFLKAKEVSLPGKKKVAIQEASEDKKEYVGGDKNLRYTGNVVWYDWKKGFGFVKVESGYDIPDEVPKEIRVHREEICCGQDGPHLRDNMEVEFGISKNQKGNYAIHNLTLPGGDAVTRAAFENRKEAGNKEYSGEIKSFLGGFGWIEPADKSKFPADIQKKLTEMTEKRSKRSKDKSEKDEWIYVHREDVQTDVYVDRGQKCTFKLHTSDKGVGANSVKIQK